jgi:magnesium chelatase family protein
MTSFRLQTVAFAGVETLAIDVQIALTSGLPNFILVGLPDKAVGESRERVRAALSTMGLAMPSKRIVVNLAPADVQKEGSHYDLPIALAVLAAMGLIPADILGRYVTLGELALDGRISGVNGTLPTAMHALEKNMGLICPAANGPEAAWVDGLDILAADSLAALLNHIKGAQLLPRPNPPLAAPTPEGARDWRDIKGQLVAKRAMEIAAAGGHNILLIGPPGSGKSMLSSRLPGILPPLSPREALEVSVIHSLAGQLRNGAIKSERPYRDPHHSASLAALIGGGLRAMPGEISLAHRGVLFLDELPEFQRGALEALRQPIESGQALIARANAHITYPAQFQLVAAMNPCRCGYLDDPAQACSKAPRCGQDYQSKISGPIFDRIDLHVDVPAMPAHELAQGQGGEDSATVRARVTAARELAQNRFTALNAAATCNAHADGKILEAIAPLNAECQAMLNDAAERFKLSARGYHRIWRVARTIADLAHAPDIEKPHLAEALGYRRVAVAG